MNCRRETPYKAFTARGEETCRLPTAELSLTQPKANGQQIGYALQLFGSHLMNGGLEA